MCTVPNLAVFCSALTSCFPGMLLRYLLLLLLLQPLMLSLYVCSKSPEVCRHSGHNKRYNCWCLFHPRALSLSPFPPQRMMIYPSQFLCAHSSWRYTSLGCSFSAATLQALSQTSPWGNLLCPLQTSKDSWKTGPTAWGWRSWTSNWSTSKWVFWYIC